MTRTLLISSFLASALMIGCGDEKADTTTTTATTKSSQSSDDNGNESTGAESADTGNDPTNEPTTNPTTGASATTTPATTTNDGTTTGASATEAGDTGGTGDTCGFICESTGGPIGTVECDVFKQDCMDGEKCAAYAEGGTNSWNATKCVPVTGEGVPGDTCTTDGGGVSGLDDCQKGAMCWDVDAMNKGICVELCQGTEAAPTCSDEQAFNCAVVNDGVLNICLPDCDPLIQDCQGDDLCIPVGDTFVCVLDASGEDAGKAFDPCEFANACDKGLICLDPALGMECDANAGGCCLPFCDLADPNAACPGAGQKCISLYDPMPPPQGFEDVGICIIPM